jgi:Flp pilus assembly protein TadG
VRRPFRRGQALVEFALVLPILVLVVLGIFDFGRAIFAYNTVSNAAREAARVAIVNQTDAGIVAEAVDHAVALHLDPTAVDISYANSDLSGGPPCNVTPRRNGCVVEVTVTYEYNAATPFVDALVGPLTISSTARMPVERSYP